MVERSNVTLEVAPLQTLPTALAGCKQVIRHRVERERGRERGSERERESEGRLFNLDIVAASHCEECE